MKLRSMLLALLAAAVFAAPAGAVEAANHPFLPQRTITGLGEDACGVAVSLTGDIFTSDYYGHLVKVWRAAGGHSEFAAGESENGPCGLAVDSSDNVYVNFWHGKVVRFIPPYTTGEVIYGGHATGIAIDPVTDDLYVDERTSVARYASPVEPEDVASRFGQGSLGDGFGVAISEFPATAGRVFAADAASGTVKAYDPGSPDDPAAEVDGAGTPQGGFVSLVDSSLALDQNNGHLFVADNLQPGFEHPAAAVDEFDVDGIYLGRLPHALVDPEPIGIAVNESPTARHGEVYVTSGNGSSVVFPPTHETPAAEASVLYGFGPSSVAETFGVEPSAGAVTSSQATSACPGGCEAASAGAAAGPPGSFRLQVPRVSGAAATLTVLAPGPGALVVHGKGLRRARGRASAAEIVKLHLHLDQGGRADLARSRSGRLAVHVLVSFAPSQGGSELVRGRNVVFQTGRKSR